MIGVDTNVLVRYLTQDDPPQVRRVDALIADALERHDLLFIDDIVLCEVVWVLRTRYRHEKSAIAEALDGMLGTALFAFQDRDLLRRALGAYRAGAADFSDCLIGQRNSRAGCDHTVTFDRALGSQTTFVLL